MEALSDINSSLLNVFYVLVVIVNVSFVLIYLQS